MSVKEIVNENATRGNVYTIHTIQVHTINTSNIIYNIYTISMREKGTDKYT